MTYDDLRANNPYVNFDYRQSPWQKFLGKLGFRTNYDAYKESMALQAREYDAQIANKQFNEEYEDPTSSASRLRGAGVNPDLNGLGDVAGASNPDISDDNPPVAPESDTDQIMQFANVCMSALTTGLAVAGDIGSLAKLGIDVSSQKISNSRNVGELANWIAHTFYSSPERWNDFAVDPSTGEVTSNGVVQTLDMINQYKSSLPRRFRDQFSRNLTSAMHSFDVGNERYKKAVEYLDNKLNYNIQRGRDPFKFGVGDDDAIMAVVKPLSELADKVAKSELELKNATNETGVIEADKKGEYLGKYDAVTDALATNAENSFRSLNASLDYQINKTMKSITSRLSKLADKGDVFAQAMLFSFSMQRLGLHTGAGKFLGGVAKAIF